MADSTLASLTDAASNTGGLFYGTQSGADRKFTLGNAGYAMAEAVTAADQQLLLGITGGGAINLGGYTLTVPATGTAALLPVANVFTAANAFSVAGDTSTPAVKLSGAWKVATATTVAQMLLADPTGSPTAFAGNAAGTGLGMNIKTFTGNYLDFQLNGISQFSLTKSLLTFQGVASSTHGMTISCDASGAVLQGLYNGSPTGRGSIHLSGGGTASSPLLIGATGEAAAFARTGTGAQNTSIQGYFLPAANASYDFCIKPINKDTSGSYTGNGHTMSVTGGKASVTTTGGAGGAVNITGGDAGSAGAATNNNGGDVTIKGGAATGSGTIGAIKLGVATSQLIGFYNTTPVVQQTGCAVPTDLATCITAITALRTAINNLGLTTVV